MSSIRPARLIQYTDPGYQEPQQPPRGMGRMPGYQEPQQPPRGMGRMPGYQEPQQPPRGMGRMIIGSIVLISTIILLIIMFTVFDEPIQILTDTFTTAYPDTYGGADSVEQMNNFLTMIFGIAIAVGVLMALLWYMIWGHKREYERY